MGFFLTDAAKGLGEGLGHWWNDAFNPHDPKVDPIQAATDAYLKNKQDIDKQTAANSVDQIGPVGSTTFDIDPVTGKRTQRTAFSGPLAGATKSLQDQIAFSFGQPIQNGDAARDQAIKAAYGQSASRLNPQWAQMGEQLDSRLANQGLDPNSQAARSAQNQFSQQRNDAYQGAMNSAIGQGTAAGHMAFQDNLTARDAPMNDLRATIDALRASQPGYMGAGVAAAPQLLTAAGMANNYDMAEKARVAQNQAGAIGQVGNLASTPFNYG